jgi:hypothetical protein
MFPPIFYATEQISGLLSKNLTIVKILYNFQHVFTANTKAVHPLNYSFNSGYLIIMYSRPTRVAYHQKQ